jgi:hypothetical protein
MASLQKWSWSEFRVAASSMKPFLWAFTLGSSISAVLLALIAYRAAVVMIVTHRNRMHRPQNTEM